MSFLNQRQKQMLHLMGIQVWRERSDEVEEPEEVAVPAASQAAKTNSENRIQISGTVEDVSQFDWQQLRATVSACLACELAKSRTQTVFGVGSTEADYMFVGEAPGAEEDRRGEPFVGRAGQLLDSMLTSIGLDRGSVFIANVLKCRPPGNRDPKTEEVQFCSGYLNRQIALCQPRLLVAVGRIAAQRLLDTTDSLARLRGKVHHYGPMKIPLIVTYHPAYLLRSPGQKRKAWEDLLLAKKIMAGNS